MESASEGSSPLLGLVTASPDPRRTEALKQIGPRGVCSAGGPELFGANYMSIISPARPPGRVNEVLASVRISQVYRALGGPELRRSGQDRYRGRAWWRDGDGFNVSLDDARNLWNDFPTGEGGGVLDLVVRVCGGSRQNALRWVADLVGCPLDDHPLPHFERVRWARGRRQIERELAKARLWLRSALALGKEVIDRLKAPLTDPTLPWPTVGEIARWTAQLEAWRRLDDAGLVAEYVWWAQHHPRLTGGLVYAARLRETVERQALRAYLTVVATGEEVDAA